MHVGKYSQSVIDKAVMSLTTDLNPDDNQNWTTSFEVNFAAFAGNLFGISVNSATSGLHAALGGLGIGPGDEVISPALTVIMDAFATNFVGATPVFADVDPQTWNIDPMQVEKLISSKTKAIISVSWLGLPANLKKLREIADKYGVFLIDDSAETIFMEKERPADWGLADCRVFSFESKKHMPTGGEGGMVTTDNEELAKEIRKFAGLGYKHLSSSVGRTSLSGAREVQNPDYLRFDRVGFNYRMNSVTAAIGVAQLDEISKLLFLRKESALRYMNAIKDCEWLVPQFVSPEVSHSYYTFGVSYEGDLKRNVSWQEFYDRFRANGGDGFYANCMNPYLEPVFRNQYTQVQKFDSGLCPVAESLQRRIMAFKTNYKDIDQMEIQANILSSLINEIGR